MGNLSEFLQAQRSMVLNTVLISWLLLTTGTSLVGLSLFEVSKRKVVLVLGVVTVLIGITALTTILIGIVFHVYAS